jgi:murein DD-endopeptidase MepM/ murein hydrolase activator NlpD
MDKKRKHSFSNFIAGKGFYIVLFLCVAAIGISGYIILFSDKSNTKTKTPEATVSAGNTDNEDNSSLEGITYPMLDEDADEYLAEDNDEVIIAPDEAEDVTAEDDQSVDTAYQAPVQAPAEQATTVANIEQPTGYKMPVAGTIDKDYSMDALVYDVTLGDWRTHNGIDIAAEVGTPVTAAADGVVSKVYLDDAMGNTVIVSHEDGMTSVYGNLSPEICVEEGQSVKGGDVLGTVGASALSESSQNPHLHFEMIYEGTPVNPMDILPKEN